MTTAYKHIKQGRRDDLGDTFFRSAWEANFARYLNFLHGTGHIHRWEYEPDTFWFEAIKRGVRSYKPDFKVWDCEESEPYYYEVKGWMDAKSKTKLKRMAKYHPDVKVILFGKKDYASLKRNLSKVIKNWEV